MSLFRKLNDSPNHFVHARSQVGASVNTVDVMYAAFPALLYLNPELGAGLLKPLLKYQDSSAYTLPYAAMNIGELTDLVIACVFSYLSSLGSSYPNATADGLSSGHQYGIEGQIISLVMPTL